MKELSFFKKCFPISIVALVGVFMLTTGLQSHKIHPLQSLTAELLPSFSLDAIQVDVIAKEMTAIESERNFGHNLISRGIKPLQLTIQNNTSDQYSMCASSVDLACVEASKVAFKITKSSIPRSIALKIASFFFWPMMIPSTIDGILTFTHHKNLKKDLLAKSLKEEVIAPYSTMHRVLFVPEDKFKETFKVTLIELSSLNAVEFQTKVIGSITKDELETFVKETPIAIKRMSNDYLNS